MQAYVWNPWSVFDELERSVLASSPAQQPAEWPVFDVEHTDDATILTADVPGMTEDELELSVSPPHLIVRGERKPKEGQFAQRRRFYGAFERQFKLGDTYDPDKVSASLANGVLTIVLNKAAKLAPRKIKLAASTTSPAKGVFEKVKNLLVDDKPADKSQATA